MKHNGPADRRMARAIFEPVRDGAAVVITTYNDSTYLRDAVASVLAQTAPPIELVVVDDGSTEDAGAIVGEFPQVTFVRQVNQGVSAARNAGLALVSARYVAFLDADDLFLPRALESGAKALEANPAAAFAYGAWRHTDGTGRAFDEHPLHFIPAEPAFYRQMLAGNVIGMNGTVLHRRSILMEAGGFDPGRQLCEDYELFLRLSRLHPVVSHNAPVALYRIHGGNVSKNAKLMLREARAVLGRESERPEADPTAIKQGLRNLRSYYSGVMLRAALSAGRVDWQALAEAGLTAPAATAARLFGGLGRRIASRLSGVSRGQA